MWGYKEWVGNFFPARSSASDFLSSKGKLLIKSTCVIIDPGGLSLAIVNHPAKKEPGL
jgi:hypothetical protein